jgi:chemotaxis protein MotB
MHSAKQDRSSIVFAFFIFLAVGTLILTGCSKNRDLEEVSRQQAATIESLNNEIMRLNKELDEALRARQDLLNAQRELEEQLREELKSGDMALSMQEKGLVVTVLSRVLFDSGKADLKESAEASLAKVAAVINVQAGEQMIYVEGHTDNVPIRYSGWKSNWELSTGRATEVIHYFVEQSVTPDRIGAVGYGEYHPVASNDTEDGRLQNRRVEIVISPTKRVPPPA